MSREEVELISTEFKPYIQSLSLVSYPKISITTLEMTEYSILCSNAGFTYNGTTYETIQSLLDVISPMYRDKFAESLVERLRSSLGGE